MKNYLEVEKHPSGTQIYLNGKAYAWFDQSKPDECRAAVASYSEHFKTKPEYMIAALRTRHLKLDWNNCSLEELKDFLRQLSAVIEAGGYFRAGIGELYLSVRGVESEREEIKTVEDVLHDFRRQITVEKRLTCRPAPQKRWRGEWIDIKNLIQCDKAATVGDK